MKIHTSTILLLPLLLAACASAPPVPVPPVPPALDPGRDAMPALTVAAKGVQIYECRGAPAQWAFVAPEAKLFDAQGRAIGSHGDGPHWLADDGSRLVGRLEARADAPTAGAIPWLLLATAANAAHGRFGGVSHIQRINTVGGMAPASGCDANTVGSRVRIPYTADYRLFRAAVAAS